MCECILGVFCINMRELLESMNRCKMIEKRTKISKKLNLEKNGSEFISKVKWKMGKQVEYCNHGG